MREKIGFYRKTIGMMALLLISGMTANAADIKTLQKAAGKALRLEVQTDKAWQEKQTFFSVTPQIAVWLEDADGNLLETLYVTRKFALQKWGNPKGQEDNATFRISSLPYWMHKLRAKGLASPTKKSPLPDAITGASPKDSFTLHTKVPGDAKEVYVLMEVNNSFDENAQYPNKTDDAATEYNGQPSVVYRAKIDAQQAGQTPLTLIGHGSWNGQDGSLTTDLSTLTTATKLVTQAVVIIE